MAARSRSFGCCGGGLHTGPGAGPGSAAWRCSTRLAGLCKIGKRIGCRYVQKPATRRAQDKLATSWRRSARTRRPRWRPRARPGRGLLRRLAGACHLPAPGARARTMRWWRPRLDRGSGVGARLPRTRGHAPCPGIGTCSQGPCPGVRRAHVRTVRHCRAGPALGVALLCGGDGPRVLQCRRRAGMMRCSGPGPARRVSASSFALACALALWIRRGTAS